MKLTAVVLGWNLAEETAACGASLMDQVFPDLHVVFVDNGSTDGSPAYLRQRFPSAEVIELGTNVGIAAGYNAGLERALAVGSDFALILNNDTLFAPGMLEALVRAAEQHPEAGVFMPKICYEADRGRIWSAGARMRRFPPGQAMIGLGQMDAPRFSEARALDFAPSCALLIRRSVLESVGFFDPGYFFYYDDWDYCERVRRAGFTIRYVPDAVVWHKVSLSTVKATRPARWWYVMGRSAVRYYRNHYRPAWPALAQFAGWFVLREALKGNVRLVPHYLRGLRDGLAGRPMALPT